MKVSFLYTLKIITWVWFIFLLFASRQVKNALWLLCLFSFPCLVMSLNISLYIRWLFIYFTFFVNGIHFQWDQWWKSNDGIVRQCRSCKSRPCSPRLSLQHLPVIFIPQPRGACIPGKVLDLFYICRRGCVCVCVCVRAHTCSIVFDTLWPHGL